MFARKSMIAALLVASLSLTGVSRMTGAQTPPAPAAPAAVPTGLAVINIVDLFNGLIEKTEGEQAIEKMKTDFENQGQKLKEKADALNKTLSNFKPDSEEAKKAQDDLLRATMDFQAFSAFAQQKLLGELLTRKKGLYRKLNESVKKYAEQHNIAIVFVSNSGDVKGIEDQNQLADVIQNRKILYFHPQFDITLQVQQMMNADYQMSKSTTSRP